MTAKRAAATKGSRRCHGIASDHPADAVRESRSELAIATSEPSSTLPLSDWRRVPVLLVVDAGLVHQPREDPCERPVARWNSITSRVSS